MKRMIVCGDRNWINFDIIRSYIEMARMMGFDSIVEGEAEGADSMARDIGKVLGFEVISEPADWDRYHKAAGPIRNAKMLTHKPILCLAFHKNIQESRGTLNMITQARKVGVPVILVDAEEAVQVFLPTKATWMIMESVKGFLVTLVQDAMNAREGEVPFTRDDAEEFMKERGLDAVHK